MECRSEDAALIDLLAQLEDAPTRAAVTAERAVLAVLEAGCSAPLGALGEVVEGEEGPELWIRAAALSLDGALCVRQSISGPVAEAEDLGRRLASAMLEDGAADLIAKNVTAVPTQAPTPHATSVRNP